MDAARRRGDELAEIALRILVRLYDAWPDPLTVIPNAVYRPAGRYTGPNDALPIMRELLGRHVTGSLAGIGLVDAKLDPAMLARLDEIDERGVPRIAEARAVIAEACSPQLGHAAEVRDGLWT